MPEIIEKCYSKYNAFECELRYPRITPGPWNTPGSIEWVSEHKLSEDAWEQVISKAKDIPYRVNYLPIQKENSKDPHVTVLKIFHPILIVFLTLLDF